ncbi:hypothetical protein Bca52824_032983 [Brassica carinata]|uniref:Uncharacterized protein n=1 Tax=Brassica carinata TaxID=52824 RepID=A0A8X7SE49_BRACI|nr:hypothetical protein Bca52824_032983 [Brassica carinata]
MKKKASPSIHNITTVEEAERVLSAEPKVVLALLNSLVVYLCLKELTLFLLCDAKYCSNCVRRAMGDMPEGRKCVTCIGHRVSESNRKSLGKCSRMLKRLLTDSELQQVMLDEVTCKANQLYVRLISVNGRPLSEEELDRLQTCPNPPKKLKPGDYWYDKLAGYWGKVGEKPCQIISHNMNIGGAMMEHASNGDTDILINFRERTKTELMMLKVVEVVSGDCVVVADDAIPYGAQRQRDSVNLSSIRCPKMVLLKL